jgi:hypothetical protein
VRIPNRAYYPIRPLQPDTRWGGPSGTPQVRQIEADIAAQASPGASDLVSLLAAIKQNTDIQVLLQTIGLGFVPRNVTILPATTNGPTQIIVPNQAPRGYILLNPAEISGFSTQVTFFASAARAAATYTSSSFNVSGVDSARVFLDVTANATPLALTINAQSQDPLSGNWATSQADIFSGNNAVDTYYADIGPLGVDSFMRLQAVVGAGVGTVTFSISGVFKGGINSPVGSTVYIGGPDVNVTLGYPILAGDKYPVFLRENVGLFAISAVNSLVLKIFQLQ